MRPASFVAIRRSSFETTFATDLLKPFTAEATDNTPPIVASTSGIRAPLSGYDVRQYQSLLKRTIRTMFVTYRVDTLNKRGGVERGKLPPSSEAVFESVESLESVIVYVWKVQELYPSSFDPSPVADSSDSSDTNPYCRLSRASLFLSMLQPR